MKTTEIKDGISQMLQQMMINYLNNETYAKVIKTEYAKGDKSRAIFNNQMDRCRSAITQLTALMQPETVKAVRENALNEECALQLQAIETFFLCLPKGKRDEIERYVKAQFDIYKLNQP